MRKKTGLKFYSNLQLFSFQDALKTGFLSYADIIVLADDFYESSHIDFHKLVQVRLKRKVELISWDKIDFDKLIDSISTSIENIKKSQTSHFFASRLVRCERKKVFLQIVLRISPKIRWMRHI